MKTYDDYEISPCTRTEEPDSPGKFYFEVCEPEEADVWTLYGHIDGEGAEAIGDFTTREAAEQVYFHITGIPFTSSYQAESRLRVMHAAPRLLTALKGLLDATEGLPITVQGSPFNDAIHQTTLALAEAEGEGIMTRYFITAWCDRPFFTQCEVDADTPEQALLQAREAIHDAPAEECDDDHPWDEWRVDTAETDGVLLHLDAPARLRAAALGLLRACRMVVERWEHGDLGEAARACRDAVAEATDVTPTEARKPIVIEVRGGVVQEVRNLPPEFQYQIVDHDDREEEPEDLTPPVPSPLPPDPEGMNEARSTWAAQAIDTFREATGTDEEDALCDLLADMMHWADRRHHDFDAALLRAHDHYEAETLPESG